MHVFILRMEEWKGLYIDGELKLEDDYIDDALFNYLPGSFIESFREGDALDEVDAEVCITGGIPERFYTLPENLNDLCRRVYTYGKRR